MGLQAPTSHRPGYRRLRGAAKPWAWPAAERDHAGCGEPAALSARGHALAQPDRHPGSGQRLDPAPRSGALGRNGIAGEGPRAPGRHAARPPRSDPRYLLGAGQARRRSHRPQPDRSRPSRAPNTTLPPTETACRSPVSRRRPMSMTRLPSSGCSWPPLQLWPVSAPCSRTKATTLSTIAIYVAPSEPNPSIHKRGQPRGSGLGQRPLAGRAQQCQGLGKPAPCSLL